MTEHEFLTRQGALLRELRGAMPLRELATKLGKNPDYLSKIERGEKPLQTFLLNQWVAVLGGIAIMEDENVKIYKKAGA